MFFFFWKPSFLSISRDNLSGISNFGDFDDINWNGQLKTLTVEADFLNNTNFVAVVLTEVFSNGFTLTATVSGRTVILDVAGEHSNNHSWVFKIIEY